MYSVARCRRRQAKRRPICFALLSRETVPFSAPSSAPLLHFLDADSSNDDNALRLCDSLVALRPAVQCRKFFADLEAIAFRCSSSVACMIQNPYQNLAAIRHDFGLARGHLTNVVHRVPAGALDDLWRMLAAHFGVHPTFGADQVTPAMTLREVFRAKCTHLFDNITREWDIPRYEREIVFLHSMANYSARTVDYFQHLHSVANVLARTVDYFQQPQQNANAAGNAG